MSEPVLKISEAAKAPRLLPVKPPRLNESVFVARFDYLSDMTPVAATIRKCGLVAELVVEDGKKPALYAARRRPRNKHD